MWFLERLYNLNDHSILKPEVLHEEDFININQKKRCLPEATRIIEENWVCNKTRRTFNKHLTT
jgi:hypothetical protein